MTKTEGQKKPRAGLRDFFSFGKTWAKKRINVPNIPQCPSQMIASRQEEKGVKCFTGDSDVRN